ncbi:DUF3021 domain-containing protein [Streptococcus pluranimalium]|uniref:DUF3021 domain-containing protein n=1 Tax=Streptococcus pluranimalium TaxID=82348 RepID=UPI0031397985
MRKIVRYFMMGVGIGSFLYIVSLLAYGFEPTWENVIVDWLASGLMGISGLIHEHPKWSDATKNTLNLLAVYVLVMGMLLYNAWLPLEFGYVIGSTIQFILIYGLIVLYFAWQNKDSVSKINQKLRNKENKS